MRILYLITGTDGEQRGAFRDRVLAFASGDLAGLGTSVCVAVTESEPPRLSVIPFRKDLMALISLDGVDTDASWPDPPPGFAGAHRSEAAWPVVHHQDWPMGERTPGAGLLTLFRRRPDIGEKEFLRRWYEGHTPLTLEVHPNAGYVRNRVVEPFRSAGIVPPPEIALAWDGIVEEQYDPASDLTNPARFFGSSPLRMIPVMLRVYRDVKGFIDYGSIRTWFTAEYRLKEERGLRGD